MRRRSRGRKRPVARHVAFTARIVRDEDGWYVAYCQELPGCVTQGKTIAEAEANFAEALALYLETLADLAGPKRRHRPSAREALAKVTRYSLTPVQTAGGR
ncbi:MAG TPA: type II toxin-antitoxin system HicB family antitoxin [Thermoplasmata archaeon]|nr:type II toxin-antitoxin system HicB family antitoxin [Thermoplasmata archaeon]